MRRSEHHVHDRRAGASGKVALELENEFGEPSWAVTQPALVHVHHAHVDGNVESFRLPMSTLQFHAERWAAQNPHWKRRTVDERLVLLVPLPIFERACEGAEP